MSTHSHLARNLLLLGSFAVWLPGGGIGNAQPRLGAITGLVRTATKVPVGEVTVTAIQDGGGVHGAISNSEGAYSFSDLAPGTYSVIAQAQGYPETNLSSIQVTAGRAARADLVLATPAPLVTTVAPPPPVPVAAPAPLPSLAVQTPNPATSSNFWKRWKGLVAPKDRVLTASLGDTPALMPSKPAPDPFPAVTPATDPAAARAPATSPAAQDPQAPKTATPAAPAVDLQTPFAYGDFTWLNGSPRNKDTAFDTPFFTPEIRFDTHYMVSSNQPRDHTLGGSTEQFRNGEIQLEQASVGGDFHWQNVRGRILTMFGMFATTTPRNDASAGVGQWDLRDAYRYISEAYGGYHFNVNHGLNVDAGIFVSYIGLFSYYNFDNWTYQPSYVSSNTPWFFNGLRVQWFPTNKLKIEPWIINGWQSYAKFNGHHGFGGQILYMPHEWLKLVFNNYGNGTDDLNIPGRSRIHTDDSIEVRYFNDPENTGISKAAFSFTADAGCEYGAGVTCHGGKGGPKQAFLGWMLYNRIWLHKDLLGLTVGGGQMNNPGRYLTLLPPINGADAVSGSPYFTANPGDKAHMWDSTVTLQYMPNQYITWWAEVGYRHSDVPYFTGRGGITPPGGNNGAPAYYVCNTGATSGTGNLGAAQIACGGAGNVWFPDLRRSQATVSVGVMVKF